MASNKKLSKSELRREPSFNVWLRSIQERIEEMGGNLLTFGLGVVVLLILFSGIYGYFSYNRTQGETAFAKALEIYNADVKEPKDAPTTPQVRLVYTDEKKKYTDAIAAFEKAAAYSKERDKSRYYAAICRLKLDTVQGQKELKTLAEGNGQVAQMARLALADSLAASGQVDAAIDLYKQLQTITDNDKNAGGAVLPAASIQVILGGLYENKGNQPEAVKAYLKALELNHNSRVGVYAYERLNALDPENARKVQPPKIAEDDTM
ncbi:MAG: hypothetical protein K1Y36_25320 [Blastocatellia bacterium]|nr:hypothetical protein [Blastocatellia bacterium]